MSASLLFRSLLLLLAVVHVAATVPYTITKISRDVVPLSASAAAGWMSDIPSSRDPIGSTAAPMPVLNISFPRPEGTRWFYLYVPQSLMNSKTPVPLVFYFHGFTGDATNGLGAIPEVESFGYVLISGEGTPGLFFNDTALLSWNAGTWSGGGNSRSSSNAQRHTSSAPHAYARSHLCFLFV
jgi:hypothetical protein